MNGPALRVKGRTALVTGSSRGLGRAIALALADEGADVAVNYVVNKTMAEDVANAIIAKGRRTVVCQADVSDYDQVIAMRQAVEESLGPIDILVNNAGVISDKTFVKMDHAQWQRVLSVNLDGTFYCSKAFIEGILAKGWGRIVNMTAFTGQAGNFGQANYAAATAGIMAFTKSLAKELASKGITVNAVAAGFAETDMVRTIPERVLKRLIDQIPMKRLGRPEEVARAVIYLVSSDGDYITGQQISVNGGLFV
jgi:NAD(P)-dependent dehydrogenase (short-subunit alcohol dehydrogenase family)